MMSPTNLASTLSTQFGLSEGLIEYQRLSLRDERRRLILGTEVLSDGSTSARSDSSRGQNASVPAGRHWYWRLLAQLSSLSSLGLDGYWRLSPPRTTTSHIHIPSLSTSVFFFLEEIY